MALSAALVFLTVNALICILASSAAASDLPCAKATDAATLKSCADAQQSFANANKISSDDLRAQSEHDSKNASVWIGNTSDVVLKVLIPVLLIIVLFRNGKLIGSLIQSRTFNVSLPGGIGFGVSGAIVAATANLAAVPSPSLRTAAESAVAPATSTPTITPAPSVTGARTAIAPVAIAEQAPNSTGQALADYVMAFKNRASPAKKRALFEAYKQTTATSAQLKQFFDQVDATILLSQLNLLTTADRAHTTVGQAQAVYDQSIQTRTLVGVTFSAWLSYLVRFGLIKELNIADPGAPLIVTALGRRYIAQSQDHNLAASLSLTDRRG